MAARDRSTSGCARDDDEKKPSASGANVTDPRTGTTIPLNQKRRMLDSANDNPAAHATAT
jgi:hypothetical protein